MGNDDHETSLFPLRVKNYQRIIIKDIDIAKDVAKRVKAKRDEAEPV